MASAPPQKDLGQQLSALPVQPGVYLFKDTAGRILYVGKAASLRHRVRSYFQTPFGKEPRIQRMVEKIGDFEYTVTETVSEALILENLLIKRHRPHYNARLKDDKTYPYIKIDLAEAFPQLYFTRRVLADGARYFGPFASAGSVRKTMDLLKKLFPYRSCTKTITGTDERPCLEFYIHRCVAPCTGAVNQEEYRGVIGQVIHFLEGDTDPILAELRRRMREASGALRFELAAVLRDQIRAIESVSESQKIASVSDESQDVVAVAADQGEAWVELFQVRHGRLAGRDHFLMESGQEEMPETLLTQFVQQYYDTASTVPPVILVQRPLDEEPALAEWLSAKRGGKVRLHTPQRGDKRKLMDMVAENARAGLAQKRARWLSESDKVLQAQIELQEVLSLANLPERIECYDISNIQGTNSVGSMVVFEGGRPKSSEYRRFRIQEITGIDDYASMQEMLRRRFRRLGDALRARGPADDSTGTPVDRMRAASSGEGEPDLGIARVRRRRRRPGGPGRAQAPDAEESTPRDAWGKVPDLVLIDGGRGHLSAALEVFLELGVAGISLASIAKQEEELFLPHQPEPVVLPRTSQALYLVQRVRDEAHRFAVTYHRQRRSRSAVRSALDAISGIGPARRRGLLRHFGSVARIREAPLEEIAVLPGIGPGLASRIKDGLGDASGTGAPRAHEPPPGAEPGR